MSLSIGGVAVSHFLALARAMAFGAGALFGGGSGDNCKLVECGLEGLCRLAFAKAINALAMFADVDGQLDEVRIA